MIREAGPDDRDRLEALLLANLDGAMFPVSNLRAHGLGAGAFASDHRHAARFWFVDHAAMVAVTQEGMLMALLDPSSNLADLPGTLAGMTLTGAATPAAVRAYLAIGFRPAADVALVLFHTPVTLPT